MRRFVVCTFVVGAASSARANPDALVPTLSPPGNWVGVQGSSTNVFGRIDYEYEEDSAHITREAAGATSDPNAPLPTQKDLVFHQVRHTITPRIEVGLLKDVFVYGALPIIVSQSRELHFDSGVDRTTSSTVADGILPMQGYDAQNPTTPTTGDLAFRGVDRHGLDQIYLGFGVAPMNQARDDTKPTWKIGAEGRIAIGRVMRFDPTDPSGNTAVGSGVHELRLWTTFDRRLGWAEPYFELFWQTPLASTSASLFQNPGFGATNTDKQQLGGVAFGVEMYAIDDAKEHNRVSLELGARATAHFEGRDYSEMWEVFALAGNTNNPNNPLILDGDPTAPGTDRISHPGISNIENYLETAAHVALRGELGPHVRFAALGDFVWKTDHAISFADAGVDRNGNNVIDPGTNEVNPLHVDRIDLVGHRYHSTDNFGLVLGVQGMVLF